MMVIATSGLITNHFFQLLAVWVGFNTLVYAAFAFGKLWPRRPR
jgi:hypothetical protein